MEFKQKKHKNIDIEINGQTTASSEHINQELAEGESYQISHTDYAYAIPDGMHIEEIDSEEAVLLRKAHKDRFDQIKRNAQILVPSEKATERSDFKGEDTGKSAEKRDTRSHMRGSRLRKKRLMAEEIQNRDAKRREEREKKGLVYAYDERYYAFKEARENGQLNEAYANKMITHFLSLDLKVDLSTDEKFMNEIEYLENLKIELELMERLQVFAGYTVYRKGMVKNLKLQGIYEQYQYKTKKIKLLINYYDAKKAVLTDGYYRTHYDEELSETKPEHLGDSPEAFQKYQLAEKLTKLKAAAQALSEDSEATVNIPDYKDSDETGFIPTEYIDGFSREDQRLSKEFWARLDEYKKYYTSNNDPEAESSAINMLEKLREGTGKLSPFEQMALNNLEKHFIRQYDRGNMEEVNLLNTLDVHKNPKSSMATVWTDVKDQVLFPHQPKASDVQQRLVKDCYMLSTLASVAEKDPMFLESCMTDLGDSVAVRLFLPPEIAEAKREAGIAVGGTGVIYVRVSKSVARIAGAVDMYAHGPLWVSMFEKAYAIAFGGADGYDGISNGNAYETLNAIYGNGYATTYSTLNREGGDIVQDTSAPNEVIRSKRMAEVRDDLRIIDEVDDFVLFEMNDDGEEVEELDTTQRATESSSESLRIKGKDVQDVIDALVSRNAELLPSIEAVVEEFLIQHPKNATATEGDERLIRLLQDGLEYQFGLNHEPFSGEYTRTANKLFDDFKSICSSGETIIVGADPGNCVRDEVLASQVEKNLNNTGIRANHAYSVMGLFEEDGFKYVELRDPYARFKRVYNLTKDNEGNVTEYEVINDSDAVKLTTGEKDGRFVMELNDFLKTFTTISGIKKYHEMHGGTRVLGQFE